MYMPGGLHTIRASKSGKAYRSTVSITTETAQVLQASLVRLKQERAPQLPFFDRDHEEKEAMAWPKAFFWQDSPEPGVYCAVEWSAPGAAAIRGHSYRAFSPSFYGDGKDPEDVTGMDFVGGSLVNKPAFRKMAPLWCMEADIPHVGSRVMLPVRCDYVGSPFEILHIAGDEVILESRHGEKVVVSATRLFELLAMEN
jgi:hypothetical protein